ncbi:MAG: hydantoinase/carbamoylase family amidase [Elusimicrobia bacterium]|nr:hydantoinase/carbamoylase family amidase [Elusimicrobiota bacterium]
MAKALKKNNPKKELRVDGERLYKALHDLGEVGAYKDESTGIVGVNRLALSEADGAGRRKVVSWMKELGLSVSVDQIGNVYAERRGETDLPPVMMGSHIDSVPTAGRFDGCLGVLGALEVMRTLSESGLTTKRPLVAAFFTEEEGCRFGTDMLGSAVATGRIPLEAAYALKDAQGLTVKGELEKTGFLGPEAVGRRKPHAYLECHIEQGPSLRHDGFEIGVVTGVQAISWQELTIVGKSAHAGTTPMEFRKDAGVAAARINLKLREMIASGMFGKGMRATMGVNRPHPGMVNVVPGRVVCTVDLRHPEDGFMEEVERELVAFYKQVEKDEGVSISWRQTARTAMAPFSDEVQSVVEGAANELGLSNTPILSGAGHDAQEWSRACKTAMVFVPGEYDGISHNPREFSTLKQCADGVNVLLGAALTLTED